MSMAASGGALFIARQLQEAITGGIYGNKEQLPPERQLAASYGASRTTIRKALLWLEAQKLIERKAGSGTFVTFQSAVNEHDITEVISPLELIEVRAAMEPQIARLAVLHANARDVDKLHSWLEALQMAEDEADQERYSLADEQFHHALAASTSNPLMSWLYKQINVVRGHMQWGEMKRKILNKENMRLYNIQHDAVLKAMRTRDADAAVAAMTLHMDKARNDLIGASSR
jgi:DNA-binding FadR family transcriptional regulator